MLNLTNDDNVTFIIMFPIHETKKSWEKISGQKLSQQ